MSLGQIKPYGACTPIEPVRAELFAFVLLRRLFHLLICVLARFALRSVVGGYFDIETATGSIAGR